MSTYKLTPLEELRLEKKRLREERAIASRRLAYQLQYLNDNWGSMLTKGVTSSVKTKFAETMDNLSGGSSHAITPFITRRTNPWVNFAISNMPLLGSIAWGVAKPAILAFAAKRVTSFLFGRKRKTK
ncbi:MAG: hypothetical protein A2W86_03880 [Bacteroidetes bacterium GWD2_45_23]|nr:MAG: hypothetical protein A2W87_14155 [Bacteroidetes bacterium GWC2_46_850]OFX86236.1 MAG: hypothetical protein A2W86_03880 [Bacteroidetes bacterium GWD2_45_23]HAR38316.1 hypothetical protein [Porphyromonadaceae bacterium]HCC17373.1 hypothetical protein [Porphyromonadaceae bacterium]